VEELHRERLCPRAVFGRLEDDGVPAHDRNRDCADRQPKRRVPRSYAESIPSLAHLYLGTLRTPT
jgi:hypothetical protein